MKHTLLFIIVLFANYGSFSQVKIQSFDKPQISSNGLFGKSEKITDTLLPAIENANKQFNESSGNKLYKFAEPKLVDISPLSSNVFEINDKFIIYRKKIVAQNATTITVSFDKMILSSNAELFIYNPEGTIITGPVTSKENIVSGRIWSSNSFPGNAVIIEIKIPSKEKLENKIHVNKVLFGYPDKKSVKHIDSTTSIDSTAFGHFNFSSSCNINVLCPQGNAYVNERKAICLIETDDGGSGSGALVKNACNLNIPYVLTAWHITDGRNPNNFTYIFGWWSSTCTPNTNNQQALLFNGATLRATYEPTDFSLVELFQTPSPSSDITFLGWSRSVTAPITSVGIHHPSGDQMKISFANSPASIGNVRLNSNTAWRVLWNSGIAQPGSSGSPLFDPNRRVIGQLYSITQPAGPPCNQLTGGTNYGRFDLSWTGGGTNNSRLSNWLDPLNTNVATTNTAGISTLANAYFTISGNANLCTTQTYSVNTTLPITWGSTPPGYVTFSCQSCSTTIATRVSGVRGNINITATVASGCGNGLSASPLPVAVGSPVAISYTKSTTCTNGFQTWNPSVNPTTNGSNWVWTVGNVTTGSVINIYNPNSTSPQVNVKGFGAIRVNYTDLCGTAQQDGLTVFSSCPPSLLISPNPATDVATISLAESNTNQNRLGSASLFSKKIYKINVVNKQGNVVKVFRYRTGINSVDIKLSELINGTYTLQAFDGVNWSSNQLLIMR